eukprot:scaffold105467_cov21-Tisochrysis_lutea.AAC.1
MSVSFSFGCMSERPLASINISDDNIAFTAALPCMQDLIIVDVFNGGIFPKDEDAWPAINVSVPLRRAYSLCLRRKTNNSWEGLSLVHP